ncbi:glutathione S-transferase family protein [Sphingosinicellaceae bacterium]|nr:glutathione S-transferase family protein [Sphingosinicellaceae bacterium]
MTITLYHCADARSFRALWTLEEMGLPYELKLLPFPPRSRSPGYLEENPLGTIPLLVDDTSGAEERLTESSAIAQYLCTRYGPSSLAVAADEPGYGAWLNWLHHGEATLTFPQTIVLRYRVFEPGKGLQQAADDYAHWFARRTILADAALDGHAYLCADRFTVADISVGYALLLADNIKLIEKLSPRLQDYWRRLQLRPGFIAAKAAQRAPEVTRSA